MDGVLPVEGSLRRCLVEAISRVFLHDFCSLNMPLQQATTNLPQQSPPEISALILYQIGIFGYTGTGIKTRQSPDRLLRSFSTYLNVTTTIL
jgi:hypothetical protein